SPDRRVRRPGIALRRDPHTTRGRRGPDTRNDRRPALLLALVVGGRAGDRHPERSRPAPLAARIAAGRSTRGRSAPARRRGGLLGTPPVDRKAAALARTASVGCARGRTLSGERDRLRSRRRARRFDAGDTGVLDRLGSPAWSNRRGGACVAPPDRRG